MVKASEAFMVVDSSENLIEKELRRRVVTLENVLDDVAGLMEHQTGVRPMYVYEALLGRRTDNFNASDLQISDESERKKKWESKLTGK